VSGSEDLRGRRGKTCPDARRQTLANAIPVEHVGAADAKDATGGTGAANVCAVGLVNGLYIGVVVVRDILLAKSFGVTYLADAFAIAITLPELFQNFLTAGLIANACIPTLARQAHGGRETHALSAVGIAMRWTLLGAAGLLAAALLGIRWVILPFAPGAGPATIAQATQAALWLWPAMPLLLAGGFAAAVMQYRRRFLTAALAPVVYNLPLVAALVLFGARWGTAGAAAGALAGAVAQLGLQWRGVHGVEVARRTAHSPAERRLARELLLLALPIALTQVVTHLGRCVGRAVATTQGVGGVAALTYASRIIALPLWVVVIPTCAVFLPAISSHILASTTGRARELVDRAMSVVLFIAAPMALLICAFRYDIARVLLQRGAFGPDATLLTGKMVGVFALCIVPQSIAVLLARVAYGRSDPSAPLKAAGIGVIVEGTSAWLLAQAIGLPGIALASFLGWSVHAGLLILWESRQSLTTTRDVASHILMPCVALVPMAAVAFGLHQVLSARLALEQSAVASLGAMAATATVAGGLYLLVAAALRMRGYQETRRAGPEVVRVLFRGRLNRRTRGPCGLEQDGGGKSDAGEK